MSSTRRRRPEIWILLALGVIEITVVIFLCRAGSIATGLRIGRSGTTEASLSVRHCEGEDVNVSLHVNDHYWEIVEYLLGGSDELLFVDFTAVNESTDADCDVVTFYRYYVTDETGQVFEATPFGDISLGEDFLMDDVETGEPICGRVGFRVPHTRQSLWLHYTPYFPPPHPEGLAGHVVVPIQ